MFDVYIDGAVVSIPGLLVFYNRAFNPVTFLSVVAIPAVTEFFLEMKTGLNDGYCTRSNH